MKMKKAVPTLTDQDLKEMRTIPFRTIDRDVIRNEPLIYRLEEAVLTYGPGTHSLNHWIVCWKVCVCVCVCVSL